MSNSNRRPEGSSHNSVHDEAIALLKEGIRKKIPASKINDLRKKYNSDDMVDRIQEAFYEMLNEIKSKAKKFVKLVNKKFGDKGLPLHIVLKESKKYKTKYNLSDVEFHEFKTQYEKLYYARYSTNEYHDLVPNTSMAQLFGSVDSLEGLVIKDADFRVVEDIIKLYTATKHTHSDVVLQSMQYQDYDSRVMLANYHRHTDNLQCAINPVLVAMFTPKIDYIEKHFLYTNIAYIVKCAYEKVPMRSFHDVDLKHNMILDSNDIVCSADSPLKDLRLRATVQNNMWNCVRAMRNGKFFDCVGQDFFTSIDQCKISMQDAPDLAYAGDEGIVMKRLMAAMSFNPLIVQSEPVFGIGGNANPMNFPVISNRVVSRPLLTVRLENNANAEPVELESAINTTQVYIEHGMPVPKTQKIVYSRGAIVFHVPRRSVAALDQYQHILHATPRFTQVPSHILVNERLNTAPINFLELITVESRHYSFASAVTLEKPTADMNSGISSEEDYNNIIVGTACVVRNTAAVSSLASFDAPYLIYSPKAFGLSTPNADTVSVWEGINNREAAELLSRQATIFIFREVPL